MVTEGGGDRRPAGRPSGGDLHRRRTRDSSCRGSPGRDGSFHARRDDGVRHAGGGGGDAGQGRPERFDGPDGASSPVFDTVEEAVAARGARTRAVIYVPARPSPADAIVRGRRRGGIAHRGRHHRGRAGRSTCSACCTPTWRRSAARGCIGPNCPGRDRAGPAARSASCPGSDRRNEGPVGIVSRSGTLTYEVIFQLTQGRDRPDPLAWGSAATRSSAPTSSTAWPPSRPTPTPARW